MKYTIALILSMFVLAVPVSAQQSTSVIDLTKIGDRHWRAPVAQITNLPTTGNRPGDTIRVIATWGVYYWNGFGWVLDSTQGPKGDKGDQGVQGNPGVQ